MMSWRVWVVAGLLLVGCTKPNPRSCKDGSCTDPSFPFCDTDGALAGEPQTCITVACTPGEFAGCRGDLAITCNTVGGDYDLVQCERGCDEAAGGCHLCDPNQTACTNGKVATCDAAGKITASETCALGCFEAEPRCREIVPSNGLASLIDMPQATDVEIIDANIDSGTGTITTASGPLLVPSTVVDGGRLRVFVVNKLLLRDVTLTSMSNPDGANGPSVAFVARGPITIEGRIRVLGGAGGEISSACLGGDGYYREGGPQNAMYVQTIGSGGGGNATTGARGGDYGTASFQGGAAGGIAGTASLVPLRGGCASGGVVVEGSSTLPIGSPGGGALQLTSRVSIEVKGILDARGAHGAAERVGQDSNAYYGGGAGGGLLLEAPTVTLRQNTGLIAKGGGGAAEGPQAMDDTTAPDLGNVCTPAGIYVCGNGGNGATIGIAATNGGDTATSDAAATGGGGGGLGRIRINTRTGSYDKDTSVVEAGALTTATVQTR